MVEKIYDKNEMLTVSFPCGSVWWAQYTLDPLVVTEPYTFSFNIITWEMKDEENK